MDALDNDLRQADPALPLPQNTTATLITEMAERLPQAACAQRRRGRWKNWRFTVPMGVAGAALLTGAAVALPLVLGVDDQWVDLDLHIPITYETTSGVTVTCEYGLFVGSAGGRSDEDEQVAAFLAGQDWDGIGQEVYDHALAHPVTPQPGEVWTNDTPETRATISFKLAFSPVLRSRLPGDLRGNESGWSSTDTCNGPF